MKRLILIPVIHAEGSNLDIVDIMIKTNSVFEELDSRRKDLWSIIHQRVSEFELDPQKTKLFVDGYTEETKSVDPITLTREQKDRLKNRIAQELGYGEGETNLILSLVAQGIPLMKTEEKSNTDQRLEVVTELAEAIKEMVESDNEYIEIEEVNRMTDVARRFDTSIDKSDLDIVRNIRENLKEGETGILILGYRHKLWDKFGQNIQPEFLDPELATLAEEGRPTLHESIRSFIESPQGGMEIKG